MSLHPLSQQQRNEWQPQHSGWRSSMWAGVLHPPDAPAIFAAYRQSMWLYIFIFLLPRFLKCHLCLMAMLISCIWKTHSGHYQLHLESGFMPNSLVGVIRHIAPLFGSWHHKWRKSSNYLQLSFTLLVKLLLPGCFLSVERNPIWRNIHHVEAVETIWATVQAVVVRFSCVWAKWELWELCETTVETIALNSLLLFTCTAVRYGRMLQEHIAMLGYSPFNVKKTKNSFKKHLCHCQVDSEHTSYF